MKDKLFVRLLGWPAKIAKYFMWQLYVGFPVLVLSSLQQVHNLYRDLKGFIVFIPAAGLCLWLWVMFAVTQSLYIWGIPSSVEAVIKISVFIHDLWLLVSIPSKTYLWVNTDTKYLKYFFSLFSKAVNVGRL